MQTQAPLKTKTTTTTECLVTDGPDGSFFIHGELLEMVEEKAAERGETIDEYCNRAIIEGLAIILAS